jgi:putative aldouronate transport system substrate-binding protein
MKTARLWIGLALVAALCMASVGCAQSPVEPQQTAQESPHEAETPATADGEDAPEGTGEASYFKKYDPGIVITVHGVEDGAFKFRDGENLLNNGYTRWVQDQLGITFEAKWIAADSDTATQKLNIAAASNDLPDVIFADQNLLSKLASADLLTDLSGIIEQYQSPLTEYIIAQNMETSKGLMYMPFLMDGKLYAFPQSIDAGGHWKTNWIRQDILDELGLEKPTTLEEMEAALAAYKAKYPDGVGYVMDKDMGGGSDLELVASAYEAYPKAWVEGEDGSLVYGSVQEGMRSTLETYAKWYQNGWLDPEFVVKDGGKVNETVTSGNFLAMKGMWWHVYASFGDLTKNVPASNMQFFPVLRGPDGKSGLAVNTVNTWGTAISKKCAHPEAMVYLYNEEMDSMYRNTDTETSRRVHEEMDKVGYAFKYQPEPRQEPDDPAAETYLKQYHYQQVGYGYFNDYETHDNLTFGFKSGIVKENTDMFIACGNAYMNKTNGEDLDAKCKAQYDGMVLSGVIDSAAPNLAHWGEYENSPELHAQMFLGSATKTMLEKKAYLDKLENETFVSIIMGQQPIEAFDQFVSDWMANGGKEITEEVNEWYDSVK